ncbi:hypothetical protein KJ840_00625 [Patescibacteria group bacterium]|nr:hypothetical protein [Patescibacteria group bacterium]
MQIIKLIHGNEYERYVVRLGDGNVVEFSDNTRSLRDKHWVVCIPTQIGCGVRCYMCGSNQIDFKRSLLSREMLNLVELAVGRQGISPDNSEFFAVSFLGIGEPTLNINEVLSAMALLEKNWPAVRMIISSAGVNCRQSISLLLQAASRHNLGLQFSLLGFTDKERMASVKSNIKLITLSRIAEIGREFHSITGRKLYLDLLVKPEHRGKIGLGEEELGKIFTPAEYFHISVNIGSKFGNAPGFSPPSSDLVRKWFIALKQKGFEVAYHAPLGTNDVGNNGCGIVTCPQLAADLTTTQKFR